MNGCMSVNDEYNTTADPDGGNEITDTWTVFGDPTLVVRTKHEGTIACTHTAEIGRNSTWYTVACPVEGATVGLYYQGKFLAESTVSGGNASFNFPAILNLDTVFVTATKQNYVPYLGYTRVVDFPVSVSDLNADKSISLYPNPAATVCTIQTLQQEIIQHIQVYNIQGQQVLSLQPRSTSVTIDLQTLAAGPYQVHIQTQSATYKRTLTKLK